MIVVFDRVLWWREYGFEWKQAMSDERNEVGNDGVLGQKTGATGRERYFHSSLDSASETIVGVRRKSHLVPFPKVHELHVL